LGDKALGRLHTHLSGIEYTPKGEKNHVTIEEGDLDVVALFRALSDFNCCGRILCESPVLEDDAVLLMNKWEEISES